MNSSSAKDIIAFAVIARHGSISAAASALGVSQPTLSRALGRLEEDLGGTLLARVGRGVALTPLGSELLPLADALDDAQERFWLRARGVAGALRGLVRVSASEVIGVHLLPSWVREFQQAYPEVTIALVASNQPTDLGRGEADIAVRLFRPQHDALITKRIGALPMRLYARRDYLASLSANDRPRFIGFDRDRFYLEKVREAFDGHALPEFDFRTDAQLAQLSAIRAGVGVGAALDAVCASDPELAVFALDAQLPPLPVWLTTHRELRRNGLLRVVYDSLADYLETIVSASS